MLLKNKLLFAHVAMFTTSLIYGVNYGIAKSAMDVIPPFAFIFFRVTGALLLFFLFFNNEKSGFSWIDRSDLLRVILCGIFGVAINQLAFFKGLDNTSTVNSSIIMTINPVLVLVISAILLKYRITLLKLIGIGMGLAGAIALIFTKNQQMVSVGGASFFGDTLIFINAASYAVYLVLVKPLMQKYAPMKVMFHVFLMGLIFVTPFGVSELPSSPFSAFNIDVVLALLFVIVCTTFITYFLNIYAMKTVSPSTVSFYIYLQPIVATSIALIGGSEQFIWVHLFSMMMIFTGVFLISDKVNASIKGK